MDKQTQTYNLKAVVMETGLKPVTIRAWERRYGLPNPKRSPGGHRLYSQHDIDMIKWFIARQEEGLSISKAVAIWNSLEQDGRDPLKETEEEESDINKAALSPVEIGTELVSIRDNWLESCLSFDSLRANQILAQAFSLYPPELVCIEVLQKGVAAVGQGWYEGTYSVQQEHFTSSQAMRRLEMLVGAQPLPTRPQRILVGCAPKDTHTLSPLLLTLLLKRQGWDVVYLGADVPVMRLDNTISVTEPHLIIFTAQELHAAANLLDVSEIATKYDIPFAFGGRIFNHIASLEEKVPGTFLGRQLEEAPRQVHQLLSAAAETVDPALFAFPERYQTTLAQFERKRGLIETAVWEKYDPDHRLAAILTEINAYFGRDIVASLRLGDVNLLNENIQWLKSLLANRQMPLEWLHEYIATYAQAVETHIPLAENPLVAWLQAYQ